EKIGGQIETFVNALIAKSLRRERVQFAFEISRVGETNLHYFSLPYVAPAWCIRDGCLYAGLYPQIVVAAAEQAARKGKSILENPDFLALRQRLGGKQFESFVFHDLPRTVPGSYGMLLCVSQLAFGIMDMFGCKTPPLVLPILPELKTHLAPAGQASWSDDAGTYSHSVSPFPGSTLLDFNVMTAIVATSFVAALAVPAFFGAHRRTESVATVNNLAVIGQMLASHAIERAGRYPGSLGELVETQQGLDPFLFVVPGSGTRTPPAQAHASAKELARWIDENSDYVYLAGGFDSNAPPAVILLHERFELAQAGRVNVLHADLRIKSLTVDEVRQLIGDQRRKAQPVVPK
ncbi:MAG: hypothetical protein L0Z55_04335, partial [Planctomycetes bacterium]|nr:hypothetical protein [Planctomycetota bacterium]